MLTFLLCSDEDKHAFEAWQAHDDAEDNFCELDGELLNFNPLTRPKSAVWDKKSLCAQYWVTPLCKIWTASRSWRDLQIGYSIVQK